MPRDGRGGPGDRSLNSRKLTQVKNGWFFPPHLHPSTPRLSALFAQVLNKCIAGALITLAKGRSRTRGGMAR